MALYSPPTKLKVKPFTVKSETRSQLLEILVPTPGDGEYPEEFEKAPIQMGLYSRALPLGIAIGERTFASEEMMVIDTHWCKKTIEQNEFINGGE